LAGYPFLILGLSLAAMAGAGLAVRRDLVRPAGVSALAALPFALTERLFYPGYWRPRFLFNLADRLGFGLEDLLFVAALAALGVVAYPVVSGRRLAAHALGRPALSRAVAVVAGTLALCGVLLLATGLSSIVAAVLAMVATALVLALLRRELLAPALIGGTAAGAGYFLCCLFLGWVVPGVFQTIWDPGALSGWALAGVPLEEVAYGAAAGVAGALFYPFVSRSRFETRRGEACCP